MKNCHPPQNRNMHRIVPIACAIGLAVAFVATAAQPIHAHGVTPPPVPANIQVPAGSRAFLVGHAFGTQNYICLPSATGVAWTLFGPQATLFNDDDRQIITHFFSPNPFESGTPVRATWQHSRDTSAVWARALDSSTDPKFVAAGAIPWVLLKVVGSEEGPTGGDTLTAATHIQRLNTRGGVMPSTGCSLSTNIGARAYVPYTADYFFFRQAAAESDDED